MNFIDRPDLPQALVRALINSGSDYHVKLDEYFAGIDKSSYDYAISVTKMPEPPRIIELTKRHPDDIYQDPEDLLWSMQGTIIHGLIEQNARDIDIAEKRIGITVPLKIDDKTVRVHFHGQMDLYEPDSEKMFDFKYTSPKSMMYEVKESYIFQLNVLAILAEMTMGIIPKVLCDTFIMKDWKKDDCIKLKDRGYPDRAIVVAPQPVWNKITTKKLMVKYAKEHYRSQFIKNDNELPFCTRTQRWQNDPVYKLYKRTQAGHISKNACRSSNDREELHDYIQTELAGLSEEDYEIKTIEAKPSRCIGYCSVSGLCNQRQAELAVNK